MKCSAIDFQLRLMPLAFALLVLSVPTLGFGAQLPEPNASVLEEVEGVVEYKKESDGSVRGHENWRMIVHPDKSRTFVVSVHLNANAVSREMILRFDDRFRPVSVYESLWSGGEFRGSGYFWHAEDRLKALINAPNGTLSQELATPQPYSLLSHSLSTAGSHLWYYDSGPGEEQTGSMYYMDTMGKSVGSMLGTMLATKLQFVRNETVEVRAGTFETKRFLISTDRSGGFELWVDLQYGVLVKMRSTVVDYVYELTSMKKLN